MRNRMNKQDWLAYKARWWWWPAYVMNIVRSSRAVDQMMDRLD